MSDYSAYVPNVHFELIPIKNLVSNQDYQRSLSEGQVALTAHNFDVNQINPVKVSRRDGINYVFNGQHTIETVALASGSRETPVWCMIYDDLSYQAKAGIFANQMKYVRRLAPFEIFNANIEAGSSDQLMIRDLVKSFDLEIGNKKQPGMICAINSFLPQARQSTGEVLINLHPSPALALFQLCSISVLSSSKSSGTVNFPFATPMRFVAGALLECPLSFCGSSSSTLSVWYILRSWNATRSCSSLLMFIRVSPNHNHSSLSECDSIRHRLLYSFLRDQA